ncbi:MAG TPA: biopolymer transporter ExbD [Verrucomicrobia bacterium]|nr:biopolymer transporter ExbD [Verrucomicrobiota bacterium]
MNFRSRSKPVSVGFQLAPMIDIMFLLLCFFISAQIYAQWETEIDITLPTAKTGDLPDRLPSEIIINIRQDGVTVVNQRELDSDGLAALLKRIVELYPGQPVLIRADLQTPYEHVIRTLDMCRKVDIWNISFATRAEEE